MEYRTQYQHLLPELNQALAGVLDSGRFILGPNVRAFEEEVARYLGVRHAIGVANGTDAIMLSLRALGIGPGDEVICPAYTFYATAEAIAAIGARPVFADITETTYTLDPKSVRAKLSPRTKALLPVHLLGQPADMDELRALAAEHHLVLIEDAAQAFGATYKGQRVGGLGDAGTFSFFPTKNLPCFGDGGLVVTQRDDVAELVRTLRFHGTRDRLVFEHVGYNSRLDEIQAAVLRLFLRELDGWNSSRQAIAARYREAGLGELVALPHVRDDRTHVYHLYFVRTAQRAAIQQACQQAGVAAGAFYETPLHLQPVFAHLGGRRGDLPVTEAMCAEGLALPMFVTLPPEHVQQIVAAVRAGVARGP